MNEEQIFAAAVAIRNEKRRSSFLDDACNGNLALREQVEELLNAHNNSGCILDSPVDQILTGGSSNLKTQRIGDFEIIEEIGRGGMGVVYQARQLSLNRQVALKVLARGVGLSEKAIIRFRREAEAAAKLHHTNIVPIYQTGEEDGSYYYAMELIDGPSLDHVIEYMRIGPTPTDSTPGADVSESSSSSPGPLSVNETVDLYGHDKSTSSQRASKSSHGSSTSVDAGQFDRIAEMIAEVADALQHAHQHGVIHRDIKPANLLLAPNGRLSITDFGLARMLEQPGMTLTGEFMGTPRYMSPEQIVAGRIPIDHRTDIYSLGATLYELITLEPPFSSGQRDQVLSEIIHKEPKLPRRANRSIPKDLEAICLKAMAKDPDQRYQSAKEMADDLQRYIKRAVIHAKRITLLGLAIGFVRRHRVAVGTGGVFAMMIVLASFLAMRVGHLEQGIDAATEVAKSEKDLRFRQDEARKELPEIEAIIEEGDHITAFKRLEALSDILSGDPRIKNLARRCSTVCSIRTEPERAKVYRKRYGDHTADWELIGITPFNNVRLPNGFFSWKAEKAGFRPVLTCSEPANLAFSLDEESSIPEGMVKVTPNRFLNVHGLNIRSVTLTDFLIDRTEVTNRQFKEFVDANGYSRKEFWKHPILWNGKELAWKEGVGHFVDATDNPGPANWANGSYPEGKADHPVRGVSWYEAAAYAQFVGKRIPTVYHWYRASGVMKSHKITVVSNLNNSEPNATTARKGLGPYGTYDMAGNVREWCWNENETGECYALGGAWSDPEYMFFLPEARPRWDRDETIGFRCVEYAPGSQPPAKAFSPVSQSRRDYSKEAPVSDEDFKVFIESAYSYDKSFGFGKIEISREKRQKFVHETIKIDSPYGEDRLILHLFLPSNAQPPYQAVMFFPGIWARWHKSVSWPNPGFVVSDGRALLWPEYDGTISRRESASTGRDIAIHHFVDARRAVDYLEQRDDINCQKLGFIGHSWGAGHGAKTLALDNRFKVAILVGGGLGAGKGSAQMDLFNFLPQIKCPVLMLNGRYDNIFPVSESQLPMFKALGASQKRHIAIPDCGHPVGPELQRKHGSVFLNEFLGKPKLKGE